MNIFSSDSVDIMMRTNVLVLSVFSIIHLCELQKCPHKVFHTGVDESSKNEIVNMHNYLRLQIAEGNVTGQPKGTDLKIMYWDPALATDAQKIADKCIFAHFPHHDPRWTHVGQNLYLSLSGEKSSTPDWSKAITEWFNEHKKYKFKKFTFEPETGHYTQVVWAQTTHIGCGYISFHDNLYYQKIYVCSYGPGGNVHGEYPYATDKKHHCFNLCGY